MKEIEKINADKIEILSQQQIKKQIKLIGTIRPHSGHICFEYNVLTGEICKAKFKEEAVNFQDAKQGLISLKRKVVIKENCIYITALNEKNALKKLFKK